MTLPIRLTARAAIVFVRTSGTVIARGCSVVGYVFGRDGQPAPAEARDPEPTRGPSALQTPDIPGVAAPGDRVATTDEPVAAPDVRVDPAPDVRVEPEPSPGFYAETPPEPAHVSEEPELVEEFAEPGAEDGAGAEVHVQEPWDGYRHMQADDVVDRIGSASAAELAALELYERAHQNRQTVLTAAERQLKLTARPSPND